jgi:hypothetical protein
VIYSPFGRIQRKINLVFNFHEMSIQDPEVTGLSGIQYRQI